MKSVDAHKETKTKTAKSTMRANFLVNSLSTKFDLFSTYKLQYTLKGFLKPILFLIVASLCFTKTSYGQLKDKKLLVLPVAFYLPETKIALGAAGLLSFRFPSDSANSRPSQLQLGGVYTQRNQILSYMFYQFYPNNGKYQVTGELGFYKYVFRYFGIGPEIDKDFQESYEVTFPRFRLNALKQYNKVHYLGLKIGFDSFNRFEPAKNGALINEQINGVQGGRIVEFGVGYQLDKRNNIFYPTKGMFLDAFAVIANKGLLSDYNYGRVSAKYSMYKELATETVVGLNVQHETQFGNPPFYQMALLGGSKHLRGYFEGRYRDLNQSMVQAEFRKRLGKRFGFALFSGLGLVSPDFEHYALNSIVSSAGGGIRFRVNQKEKINIRFDYGYGFGHGGNFYFTFSEAF